MSWSAVALGVLLFGTVSATTELAAHPTNTSLSDELCSSASPPPGRRPWVAVVLCGNFRTFPDPRVYKSIRTNLIDALGPEGNVVTFVYGKLDEELKPQGLKGGNIHSSKEEMRAASLAVHQALQHLQADGRIVHARILHNHTDADVLKSHCPMYTGEHAWQAPSYVGQLHTLHSAFQMVKAYEAKHGINFTWVAKARLDAMWLHSVAPWCTYRPGTAYATAPAPADWFMFLPRKVAEAVFVAPLEDYHECARTKSVVPWMSNSANCCGGGPTALMMGHIMRMRVPLVGPEYAGSKWGPAPVGSAVLHRMWETLVMRSSAKQEARTWCENRFIYGKQLPYFPDTAMCEQMLESPDKRPQLNLS